MAESLTLLRRCPKCRSADVRPARARSSDRAIPWGSPCRCRACRGRFFRYPATRLLPFALALATLAGLAVVVALRVAA